MEPVSAMSAHGSYPRIGMPTAMARDIEAGSTMGTVVGSPWIQMGAL